MAPARIQVRIVLCPTDFSDYSARALRHATFLSRWFESRLSVLHVIPYVIPAGVGDMPYLPAPRTSSAAVRENELRELRRFAALAEEEGATVEAEIREGDPAHEISTWTAESPAGLVVMGTHGRTGLERLLLGSVTEEVLRRAACPVLTVARTTDRQPGVFRRILCATDLRDVSANTIDFALSLAEEGESELVLVHVLEGLEPAFGQPVPLGVPLDGPRPADFEGDALQRLRKAVPKDARAFCHVEEVVVAGRARDEILRLAAERNADLVVVGAQWHHPVDRVFFGSTSRHVVRNARCPVLSVPGTQRARSQGREAAATPAIA